MSNTWGAEKPKVLLIHAYSPNNSGDGLLVTLAMNIVMEAIGDADFSVIASDAEAFGGKEYVQWGSAWCAFNRFVGRRNAMLLTGIIGPSKEIRDLAENADLILAVGGGYLRGGTFSAAVKSWGAHYGQLKLAAKYGRKSIYLSQSIGPFRGIYKKAISSKLARLNRVFVRDDRSACEFAAPNVRRIPDLAVLELSRKMPDGPVKPISGKPILIAREIDAPRDYYQFLNDASGSGEFEWALQSTGGSNNDYPLTHKMSGRDPKPLRELLYNSSPRIVVSTRLHGALSSLIAGYPAIHLSYERKGWGAYDDLGIQDFVLNARDATLNEVTVLIERIAADQTAYWDLINEKRDTIGLAYREILESIREICR